VKTGDLALILRVLGEFLREFDEDFFALLDAAIAKFADGKHKAGKGCEVVAVFGGERDETDAFSLIGAGTGHAEDPAYGCGFEAEHVVFDAGGEVGVVKGGLMARACLAYLPASSLKL